MLGELAGAVLGAGLVRALASQAPIRTVSPSTRTVSRAAGMRPSRCKKSSSSWTVSSNVRRARRAGASGFASGVTPRAVNSCC